jgi:nucleotide-binding universal stress UspA family protein
MNGPSIREILFPTDFSAASAAAGQTAADFARHFGAGLHVLHVVPSGFDVKIPRPALQEAVVALGPGLTVTQLVESGIAAPAIVAYARAHRIDLIVMGTHGRTGFSHALLGSVAEAVVRRAPCRVLTVPAAPVSVAVPAEMPPPPPGCCIVCAEPSTDLVCSRCRTRIRGEALEQKRHEERAAR